MAAGHQTRDATQRQLQALPQNAQRVIGLAAQAPQHDDAAGAAPQRLGDRNGAIGCVLLRGETLARHVAVLDRQFGAGGIEIANPQFGNDTECRGMHHAAVGGDETGAIDLCGEAGRDGQVAAQKNCEVGHAELSSSCHLPAHPYRTRFNPCSQRGATGQ